TEAWNAMFPNIIAQVGNTWGAFVQRVDDDAQYMAHLGEQITDLSQLWSFEVQRANGLSSVQVLQAESDAQIPTLGPPLAVNRVFQNSINARYQIGPFGRGWQWTDGWQRVLSIANGTVVITDSDASQRLFHVDGRGGYFAEPGDHALLFAADDGFTLQETNGS